MKKESHKKKVLIFSALLISLMIISVSALHQNSHTDLSSSNVAYVLKKVNRVDSEILNAFSEKGLKVDLIEDNKIKDTNFYKYKFIFIGNDRFNNIEYIPKNKPVILSNNYYAEYFGFLNRGSASKTTSADLIRILESNEKIKVYDQSKFRIGGTALPIYYLPNNLRNNEAESFAVTIVGYGKDEVDVVSYLRKDSSCFFGITESDYWTIEAKELFKKCIDFALGKRDKVHDIAILDAANGINGIKIKGDNGFLLNGTLECNKKYTISFTTKNIGNFTENLTIFGNIADFSWEAEKNDLELGKTTTTGSKTVNITFEPGIYNINISSEMAFDDNPENNFRSREVEVVCVEKDSE